MSTVWSHLPCCLSKGPLKDFSDIYLTTFFAKRNFGNTSARRVIFFWKCAKFYLHFKNPEENSEKSFCFIDNCIWIGCINLFQLRRENVRQAVNVFTNSPKILHYTKREYSNSILAIVINKYAKCAVTQISTVFVPVSHIAFPRLFGNGTF